MQKLKPDEGFHIEGSIVELTLCKSRSAAANRKCKLIFDFVNGFDPWLSLCQFLKDCGMIYGAGAHLYLTEDKDSTYKFSYKSFKEQVTEQDPTFRRKFLEVISEELKKLPTEEKKAETDDCMDDLVSGLY